MAQLGRLALSNLTILRAVGFEHHDKCRLLTAFDAKTHFNGLVLANNIYSCNTVEGMIHSGADFVSFGRMHMSNPDQVLSAPEPPCAHYWDTAWEMSDSWTTQCTRFLSS